MAQDAPADFTRALQNALRGLAEGIRKLQKLRHDLAPPAEYAALTALDKICFALDATGESKVSYSKVRKLAAKWHG